MLTALTGEAVQLGSVKGSAVFGRPLDLRVQVRLEAAEEEAANCFSAEVFQADNKFDAGRVLLDVSPAANKLDATIRIRSTTAVSEPWAKLILRSNCGSKVSRQYDFLTDFPTDIPVGNMLAETVPVQPALNTANAASVTQSNTATTRTGAQAPVSDWPVKRSQAKAKASQQKSDVQITQAPSMPKRAKPVETATAAAPVGAKQTTDMVAAAVGQPRLKMETFELTDEHQVLLKLSTALVAPAANRTPEEAQALAQASAVWRAINGIPAEVKAADTATPAGATTTQTATVQTPAVVSPTSIKQKLTGKNEFSNLIVYGLIGLLALTLACIAWLWLRVRKASRAGYEWLNDSEVDENLVGHEPTQFMHTNFYETETGTITQAHSQEPLEPSLEAEAVVEPEIKATEASHDEISVEDEAPQVLALPAVTPTEKSAVKASNDPQIVGSLPPHFDDPRLEERVIQTKIETSDVTHTQPATYSAELMDFVLEDIPPKVRASPHSSSNQFDKSSAIKSSKKSSPLPQADTKDSNLIDFDAFADSEPLNKPTRFIR